MSIIRQGIGTLLSRSATHGGTVYLQGMTADDKTLDIQGQTRQVLDKIDRALAEAGTDKSHILSAMIYISDIALRPRMNEVYVAWIDPKNPPPRACVGVQLEGNTLLEIIVVAASKS